MKEDVDGQDKPDQPRRSAITRDEQTTALAVRPALLHNPAMPADFNRETSAIANGLWPLAGIDEVGRGPLAGPVVAAAVILDPDRVPPGLDDSKKLPAAIREELFGEIMERALAVSVASVTAVEIDAINIRQATLLAMRRAVAGLPLVPLHILVDGNDPPQFACSCEAIIQGDGQIASIAAASIVAKVTRDRMMARLCKRYPAYGFSGHVGYATPQHRKAIAAHGPCPEHRYSFAPVKGVWFR